MSVLRELLAQEGVLLLDGAMGTTLMAAGLGSGDPPEAWNVDHTDRIESVHRRFIEAGSRIVLTNTFGGTSFRLKLHGLQDRVVEFNRAGARVARRAADAAPRRVLIAGSMGPSGELLAPMGQMTFDAARAAFADQARGLAEGGADLLWIETMSDLDEVRAAVAGARDVCDLPVCATLSFDTKGHTMMGVSPAAAVAGLGELGLAAMGANCGNGIEELVQVIGGMSAAGPSIPLIAKSNAGVPQWVGEELVYDATPARMAGYAWQVRELGATLIGACCGSTPDHVRAMAEALAGDAAPTTAAELAAAQAAATENAQKTDRANGRRRARRRAPRR